MGKDKLKRFKELSTFNNVFQNYSYKNPVIENHKGETLHLKGQWKEKVFANKNPITLELACGKGEYTVGLAKRFPNENFLGVDIKGARIHKGAKQALSHQLKNACFLRTRIELLPHFFAQGEIANIWIVFSDPFPKDRHAKHRLTHPRFLDIYRKVCSSKAKIHVKTDSEQLFNYTLGVIDGIGLEVNTIERDVINKGTNNPLLTEITTFYEKKHITSGKKINYTSFNLFKE